MVPNFEQQQQEGDLGGQGHSELTSGPVPCSAATAMYLENAYSYINRASRNSVPQNNAGIDDTDSDSEIIRGYEHSPSRGSLVDTTDALSLGYLPYLIDAGIISNMGFIMLYAEYEFPYDPTFPGSRAFYIVYLLTLALTALSPAMLWLSPYWGGLAKALPLTLPTSEAQGSISRIPSRIKSAIKPTLFYAWHLALLGLTIIMSRTSADEIGCAYKTSLPAWQTRHDIFAYSRASSVCSRLHVHSSRHAVLLAFTLLVSALLHLSVKWQERSAQRVRDGGDGGDVGEGTRSGVFGNTHNTPERAPLLRSPSPSPSLLSLMV